MSASPLAPPSAPPDPRGQREGPLEVLSQAQAAQSSPPRQLDPRRPPRHWPGWLRAERADARSPSGGMDRPSGGCLFLVPLWHPVLMAELIGTLAAMSSGPFIVQAGLGGGGDQFRAMGAELHERAARFEGGVLAVQALLRGESVDSDLWDVHGARVAPLPPEGVEWWMGGGVPKAIERAARLGDCWYGNADLKPNTAQRDIDIYRDACARLDRSPVRIPIRKDVFIAEDRADAEYVGDALSPAATGGSIAAWSPTAIPTASPSNCRSSASRASRTSSSGPWHRSRPKWEPTQPPVPSSWQPTCAPGSPEPAGPHPDNLRMWHTNGPGFPTKTGARRATRCTPTPNSSASWPSRSHRPNRSSSTPPSG